MKNEIKSNLNKIDIQIGKNLRKIRQSRQISQIELATKIGVSYQQLQKYESAQNKVSASRLALFADVFDVPITSFYPMKY